MCFRLVFTRLLSTTELVLNQGDANNGPEDSSREQTAILLVQRLSKTLVQAHDALTCHGTFVPLWDHVLAGYSKLLDHRRLGLGRAIFECLTDVLSTMAKAPGSHGIPLDRAWALWRDNNPSAYDQRGTNSNHDALVAYLQYIRQFHELLHKGFQAAQAEAVMANLRLCITESTAVIYGTDMDEMTAVQRLAIEIMGLIPTSSSEILVNLVREVADLVTLAFQSTNNGMEKGKSFVALSKAAMDVLARLVKQRCVEDDATTAVLLSISLGALKIPIHLKYRWRYEGKGTPTWKKATSTALALLDKDLLRSCKGSPPNQQSMWTTIVDISDGIMGADTDACESMADFGTDQRFDIESFSQLVDVVIPTLGSPSIREQIRRKYVQSLFEHSLIHEPHPDDVARPDQGLLDGLQSGHVGRVQDLPPKLRSNMSYVLVDHLFSLVAVHDGSAERVKLAQVAAPYLILRVSLVLKAYVSDQPLRGRMPQPLSQKREMHYMLKKLIELGSEPKAFPETMGVQSEHKKHLFLLFGLVTEALKVSWRDQEMSAALQSVLDAVGADFRL